MRRVAVVEERDGVRAGGPRELDGVVGDGVSEVGLGGELLGEQLRVVDEQVGVVGELERGGVVLAEAMLAGAERGGAVVGHVGERRVLVADAVAERPPALVRDLARKHGEALDLVLARGERRERPMPAQLRGRDREVRRLTSRR